MKSILFLAVATFILLTIEDVNAYPPTIHYGYNNYQTYQPIRTVGTYSCNPFQGCMYRVDSHMRIRNQLDQAYYLNYNLREVRYMDLRGRHYPARPSWNPYSLR